jgi:hypothetical protein
MKPSDQIRKLAADQGITANRGFIDDWTDKVSELSGETNGSADEIEQLVVNLLRAEKIDQDLGLDLFHRYLTTEKYAADGEARST